MPTLSSSHIPIPTNWRDFEQIVKSSLEIRWETKELEWNGRQGQSQNGVDISGRDYLGRHVGIQCKQTISSIDFGLVEAEVKKAESFNPSLDTYYVATTAPPDSQLQRQVRLFSQKRCIQNRFAVGLFFWPDIIHELTKDKGEFLTHFPQFSAILEVKRPDPSLLSLFTLSFYGFRLQHYMELLFGEIGQMAQEDPYQIESVVDTISRCILTLPNKDCYARAVGQLEDVKSECLKGMPGYDAGAPDWQVASSLADRIQRSVEDIGNSLTGVQLAAFKLGSILAAWDMAVIQEGEEAIGPVSRSALLGFAAGLGTDENLVVELRDTLNKYGSTQSIEAIHGPELAASAIRRALTELQVRQR